MFRMGFQDILSLAETHDNGRARIENIIKRQNQRHDDVGFARQKKQSRASDETKRQAS
jgi:hypothetical protein